MRVQYRQGDLLFVLLEKRPDCRLDEQPGLVLVGGEATGHTHRATSGVILRGSGNLYLDLDEEAQILHEEHGTLTLRPGLWLVLRQREYSPRAITTVED